MAQKKPPLWLGKVTVRKEKNEILTPKPLRLDWCGTTGIYWNKSSKEHNEGYLEPGLSKRDFANYHAFTSFSKQEVINWFKEFQTKQLLES